MEIFTPGKVTRLDDVPAGSVIGLFDGRQYVRFLRTASANADHVAVVSLGPFVDRDYDPDAQGPTSYFWEMDSQVILEEKTALSPKHSTVMEGGAKDISLGSIVMTKAGSVCLVCRTARGLRAFIDLSNGERVKDERAFIFYEDYVLTTLNELQQRHVIFDSAKTRGKLAFAGV